MSRKRREGALRKALRVLAENPNRKRVRKDKLKTSVFSVKDLVKEKKDARTEDRLD